MMFCCVRRKYSKKKRKKEGKKEKGREKKKGRKKRKRKKEKINKKKNVNFLNHSTPRMKFPFVNSEPSLEWDS